MRWSGIYGHDAIKEHLRRSLATGRVAHAYALVGPEGVGKRAVARLFAQALLCSGPEGGEPCGRCRACRQVEKGLHPDGHWIEPRDGTIGIDQV
ncbi:MAG: DNA polymerase III subunit delta', partial [Clostridia bacterium]